MDEVLVALQGTIRKVADLRGPAVVGIGGGWGTGSGVVIGDGRVLTNAHNVRGGAITVVFGDGRQAEGRLQGADPDGDLAVVEVDTRGIPPIDATGEVTGLGQALVALSNPGGRGLRATLGWVSAVDRTFRGPRGRRISGAVEHTAPLPRGSSGGPVLDAHGGLVAMNTHRLDGGFYLAIPVTDAVRSRVDDLAEGTAPQGVRLGVAVAPADITRRMRSAVGLPDRPGLLVREVVEDGPADRAGIRSGDLLVAAGGHELDSSDDLFAVLDEQEPGSELEVTLVRGVDEQQVTVSL
jgi:serine protease Do